jgi:cleavage and polyadenylation specificity factor subunit 1
MFSVYKTVHPPTGIDISVHCNFFNSKEQNLVIASANRLQIYKFNPDHAKNKKLKLECVETFSLYGTITAMKSCRYGSMTKDALVLVFGDAKVIYYRINNNT